MKILCRTLFDCTYTKVTGAFKITQLPFTDHSGKTISNQNQWSVARNQQRNWETIMQMISLRAQPTIVKYPTVVDSVWEFVFEVETDGVYSSTGDPADCGALLAECNGIPMVTGLGEKTMLCSVLVAHGEQQNIWFESVNI